MGHKSILNTERYTKMIHHGNEKYYSEVADTVKKARQLAEDGGHSSPKSTGQKSLGSQGNVRNSRICCRFH